MPETNDDYVSLAIAGLTELGADVFARIADDVTKTAVVEATARTIRLDASDRADNVRREFERKDRAVDCSWECREGMRGKADAVRAAENAIMHMASRLADGANDVDDLVASMRAARAQSKILQAELDAERAIRDAEAKTVVDTIEMEVRRRVPEAFRPDGTQIKR